MEKAESATPCPLAASAEHGASVTASMSIMEAREHFGVDQRISACIEARLYQMCEDAAAGELFDVEVRAKRGVVHLCGATNSRTLFDQMIALIPQLLTSIPGVRSIDAGGVSHP